ncbi:MAG: glycosyltransferase [Akkermansia muciniphila]
MSVSVSIIVPCYNVAAYLDQCMESLAGQSMEDIEIICVNDGSSDHTAEILREWRDRDGRVRIIDQKNSGVSVARNSGMEAAVGEYIGFVDPDDMVERNMFQLRCGRRERCGRAVCGYRSVTAGMWICLKADGLRQPDFFRKKKRSSSGGGRPGAGARGRCGIS